MFDYTPEGVRAYQNDAALNRLFSIDKSLKKIARRLGTLTFIAIAYAVYANKDKIQDKIAKGE